jgi:hypothetical protein
VAVAKPEDLYGLPLDHFVPERGALARALRDEGERDGASRIAKLRKPSVASWAVNQLVRTQQRQIAKLFEAGDATQQAQAELLAGHGDANALRDGARRERAAVDSLLEAARGLLSSAGHELSPTMVERVADTLHAAALDPAAREQVQDGCLAREMRHVGVAIGTVSVADAPPKPREPKQQRDDRARRAARAAEAAAKRANDRAIRALEVAQERRDRAAQALADAEAALGEARDDAKGAERAHRRATEDR